MLKYKKTDYRKILITLLKDKRLTSTIKRKYLQISKKKRKTTKWKKKKKKRVQTGNVQDARGPSTRCNPAAGRCVPASNVS